MLYPPLAGSASAVVSPAYQLSSQIRDAPSAVRRFRDMAGSETKRNRLFLSERNGRETELIAYRFRVIYFECSMPLSFRYPVESLHGHLVDSHNRFVNLQKPPASPVPVAVRWSGSENVALWPRVQMDRRPIDSECVGCVSDRRQWQIATSFSLRFRDGIVLSARIDRSQ
jgi:hypothetical protein